MLLKKSIKITLCYRKDRIGNIYSVEVIKNERSFFTFAP